MDRFSISISDELSADLQALADGLGCTKSALVNVLLARGLVRELRARLDFLRQGAPAPTKRRYRGDSIRELEATIDMLENNYQGEIWDAIDQR